jgi:hypothetical protein
MVHVPLKRVGVASAVAIAVAAGWLAAGGTAVASPGSGCPPRTARVGVRVVTVDQVIAVARTKIVGTVTHYQGRTETRTRRNTPVQAVIMDIGFSSLAGARPLFRRAERRCGLRVARYSSVVLFHDGLSVIADATITKFVVKTDRGWSVYGD